MKKPLSFIFPALLLLYTFGPMVSLVASGAMAEHYDCHLEKEQPCMIGRTDARETLSSMEVFGYLSVLTIPTRPHRNGDLQRGQSRRGPD